MRYLSAMLPLCVIVLSAERTFAQDSNPIQTFPENTSIGGLRLNLLYGKNVSVTGLDIGLVSESSGGNSAGIQTSLLALNRGDFTGWQWAALALNEGRVEGLQGPWAHL
jgi:hypothetical protein